MPHTKIDSYSIYYEIIPGLGHDAGWLVLLHEGLGSVGQWKTFPERLRETTGLNILLYDRPGYGRSSEVTHRDGQYIHHEASVVLPLLLDALRIKQRVHLFGHSDGATIALMFAALNPERCAGVLAEAPHVIIEDVTRNGVLQAIHQFTNGKLKNGLEKYHESKTSNMFWSWARFWSSDEARNWNMLQELKSITCPVCFIQGDNDHFGSFEQGKIIRDHIQGTYSELLLPECGHIPHFEYPDRIVEITQRFLRKHV